MTDLYVYTQYDGKDLMSVVEIMGLDSNGEEVLHKKATRACDDIATCADQGVDLWSWLRNQIEIRLTQAKIPYDNIWFNDDRGN